VAIQKEPPAAGTPTPFDREFVVPDPHIVYYDAVTQSPWSHDGGGRLPDKDDWSTYRYAVKDIILGVATHRFNKNTRQLEIRAYFVGEHPIFNELEPTKAMMIVFCCQSYQSGGSMSILFEHGIPFDVRELIRRHLHEDIGGQECLLKDELTGRLFAALSDFSPDVQKRIAAQVPLEKVCYNTYRGTWASNHIRSLLQRGIPLRWLFTRRPDPLGNPLLYADMMNHLRAVLLEGYAVSRLEDRQMGESLGKRVVRTDEGSIVRYRASEDHLHILEGDSFVEIQANQPFRLLPLIPRSATSVNLELGRVLAPDHRSTPGDAVVLVLPMDFLYLPDASRAQLVTAIRRAGMQLLVIGLTAVQLLSEAELNLAVTAAQVDPDEVDVIHADRYAD
jgi:hypothetical protein